jgi:ubiquinone/menaquinone biosynthesis C-methylase UbiE
MGRIAGDGQTAIRGTLGTAGGAGRASDQGLIAGAFGRAAPAYDRAGPPFFAVVANHLVSIADLEAGMRVLDVATGTGAALVDAARRVGQAGLVVGVDLAEPMVTEARGRVRQSGVGNVAVAVMDAEALGFRGGSFDVVMCASALYLLPRPEEALRGFRAVLGPGGTLAVAVFGADLDQRWSWRGELLRRLAPRLEPLGRRFDRVSLRRALEDAGFGRVVVEVDRLDVAYADASEWWASDWSHGERVLLELMSRPSLAAYRRVAFQAIEACRERDGALHWRPEVVYALARQLAARPRLRHVGSRLMGLCQVGG